jgi:GTPase SAR1 family protein
VRVPVYVGARAATKLIRDSQILFETWLSGDFPGIVSLLQLVVCGDQPSGKSSVLEAITEIPFPRKENLCARLATEIVLRRAPTAPITTRVIPEKKRLKQE